MSPYFYSLRWPALWWLGGISLIALIIYGSLMTGGPRMPVTVNDKVLHLGAYCILGVYFSGLVKRRLLWVVLFLLLAMSIGLEFLQAAGGQRHFSLYDMAFNGLGLALAKRLSRVGLRGWCRWIEGKVLA